MRAMILAAGLGTRLRPLTLVRPKALVPVMTVPVLDFWIQQLARAGCSYLVINAFYLQHVLAAAIENRSIPYPAEVVVEKELLGTGGGVRNVIDRFGDQPFLLINADIICPVSLKALYEQHRCSASPASLLVHHWPGLNNVAVTPDGAVVGFGDRAKWWHEKDPEIRLLAFAGIHVIEPWVIRTLLPLQFESILTAYDRLIDQSRPPQAICSENIYWREMGSVESYWRLHVELSTCERSDISGIPSGSRVVAAPDLNVADDVQFQGMVICGKRCTIGCGAALQDVILWDDVTIAPGSDLRRCVVTDHAMVSGRIENRIVRGNGRWQPFILPK